MLLELKMLQGVLWTCNQTGNKNVFLLCVLLQRVYDEEVEETIPKPDALEKQPEQV